MQSTQTSQRVENDTATILALERAALDRWGRGDPSGFLEISTAPDVVYFDNIVERRLDGLEALTAFYRVVRGEISVETRWCPKVQHCGEAAVLTYNYIGHATATSTHWNCTEVYRTTPAGWRIIQTHWSVTGSATS